MTCVKYFSEGVKRVGKGPSNEMNMYEMKFEVVTCIQPHILTERLSLRHHQDIIRHLNDAQNPGEFHF